MGRCGMGGLTSELDPQSFRDVLGGEGGAYLHSILVL